MFSFYVKCVFLIFFFLFGIQYFFVVLLCSHCMQQSCMIKAARSPSKIAEYIVYVLHAVGSK